MYTFTDTLPIPKILLKRNLLRSELVVELVHVNMSQDMIV